MPRIEAVILTKYICASVLAATVLTSCTIVSRDPSASALGASRTAPPEWMRGVWTRDWIERKGVRSNTLTVHYLQTPTLYGDMRVPVSRPSFANATSFGDLTDAELLALAKQRGFTGHVTAAGDSITWQHEIDFQPRDGDVDIGRVEHVGRGQMYEHALDNSYTESWTAVASGDDAFLVVRVERGGRLDRTLLVAGDHFVYIRNRAVDLPKARSLDSLIASTHATREQIISYLDCEFSSGTVRSGAVPWEIHASTLPWRERQRLDFVDEIILSADSSQLHVREAQGARAAVPFNSLSKAQLVAIFRTGN